MEQGSASDVASPHKRKPRFHRHSAHQIQRFEAVFKEFPHLAEKQRRQLSRELGLTPRQIKFWFQNRRTQMKGQLERADNTVLRAENDKIRCSNIALREALKNVMCPTCASMRIGDDPYMGEQQLHLENAHLKQKLDRVSSIAAKYIGRPVSQISTIHPSHMSSMELSLGSFGGQVMPSPLGGGGFGSHGVTGSSLEFDILSGTSSSIPPNMQVQSGITISEMDKSFMSEIAVSAMNEIIKLLQTNEPLWTKSATDGRDTLSYGHYDMLFPRASNHLKSTNIRFEASRHSGVVVTNSLVLVDMFMDAGKWLETFSHIVSAARTIQVLSSGVSGSLGGTLQLMYEELQVLSHLVSTREFFFLRYCQQMEQGSWAIADVSCDFANGGQVSSKFRRLPSGCLIRDMPNGTSNVSWLEHVEIDDGSRSDDLYGDFINSGHAFGAERWVANLQRMCERYASLTVSSTTGHDLNGVIPTLDGKRSMMKLSQRMVNNFCASVSMSTASHQYATLADSKDSRVRMTLHKATDPGQPNGLVLCAATSIWLPVSPQNAFDFFRDVRMRPQWDVLSKGNAVQEVAHISYGSHPGNCISILRALDTSQSNMVILQECYADSSASLVVYSPVEVSELNMAVSGEDSSCIPLLPSGFIIYPDGRPETSEIASMSSSGHLGMMTGSGGSLITIGFQMLAGSLPMANLNLESVATVNNLISTAIHQIKVAFNCPDS